MLNLNKKSKIITNLILIVVFVFVFSVSFFTERIVPISIYGKQEYCAIYKGNTEKKRISLMFNVYENTENVNKILKILSEKKVTATFFVGGCWADDNEETLKNIISSGNELGNHGYFHKDHAVLNYEKNKEEILNTETVVNALSGYKTTLFAPPSGSFSSVTLEVAESLNYKTIMWSKDTIDWRDKDKKIIVERATKNPENGDLILMHPKNQTVEALEQIIDFYLLSGFEIVCVGENIKV